MLKAPTLDFGDVICRATKSKLMGWWELAVEPSPLVIIQPGGGCQRAPHLNVGAVAPPSRTPAEVVGALWLHLDGGGWCEPHCRRFE